MEVKPFAGQKGPGIPVNTEKHKEAAARGVSKANRAKKAQKVPTPALNWGKK